MKEHRYIATRISNGKELVRPTLHPHVRGCICIYSEEEYKAGLGQAESRIEKHQMEELINLIQYALELSESENERFKFELESDATGFEQGVFVGICAGLMSARCSEAQRELCAVSKEDLCFYVGHARRTVQ